jgi:hypothetical protein
MLLSKLFNTAEKRCYWLGDFPKVTGVHYT